MAHFGGQTPTSWTETRFTTTWLPLTSTGTWRPKTTVPLHEQRTPWPTASLLPPETTTDSFFPRTVCDWSTLSDEQVKAQPSQTFKSGIQQHCLPACTNSHQVLKSSTLMKFSTHWKKDIQFLNLGYAGTHHSKYWIPIYQDTIEDGQNRGGGGGGANKNLIFYSLIMWHIWLILLMMLLFCVRSLAPRPCWY